MNIQPILAEAEANLGRGRAVATGIGVFLVVVNEKGDPLLRRRLEKDSLYGQDLSGKWEMTGGGMELSHFEQADSQEPAVSRYQRPALQALAQELEEEAGLKLDDNEWFPLVMVPAFLCRKYERDGNPRTTIDLAFSTPSSSVRSSRLRSSSSSWSGAGSCLFREQSSRRSRSSRPEPVFSSSRRSKSTI